MHKKISLLLLAALFALTPALADTNYLVQKDGPVCPAGQGGGIMKITSPEFKPNELIPSKFTCAGKDINPALVIEDIPKEAKSLALIMDDPDAPMGTWVHWVVFDIPATTSRIEENSAPGKLGFGTGGEKYYSGPCPPSGTHHYFFKLYALDKMLNLSGRVDKARLEEAMSGHILARAELVGLYKR